MLRGFGRDGIGLGSGLRIRRYRDLKIRVSKPPGKILTFDNAFRIRDRWELGLGLCGCELE